MIISIEIGKAFDNILYPFLIKNSQQLVIEGPLPKKSISHHT